MDLNDGSAKRGRGRGRGARGGRGRGRGRGRGKKAAVVVSSDEETSLDQSLDSSAGVPMEDADISAGSVQLATEDAHEIVKDSTMECVDEVQPPVVHAINVSNVLVEEPRPTTIIPQKIDMEADISQLEAPTFTTISRGPPEPMLRLKWDHKVNLIGEKVLNPMIHCCDQCDKPILLYGRMIPCKHVFCLKCARAEPIKNCPRCSDKVVRVEQSGLGMVFMCTHGGSRYGNTGCRRTYLSQRDLQAHINHRHVTQLPPTAHATIGCAAAELKQDLHIDAHKAVTAQRKLSESAPVTPTLTTPLALHTQRGSSQQARTAGGSVTAVVSGNVTAAAAQSSVSHAHSTLTQANIARINTANAQDCHQGKVALHQSLKKTPITAAHHQTPETVADASYYSSVLNSFGSTGGSGSAAISVSGGVGGNLPNINATSAAAVGYAYDPAAGLPTQTNTPTAPSGSWQQNQYYR